MKERVEKIFSRTKLEMYQTKSVNSTQGLPGERGDWIHNYHHHHKYVFGVLTIGLDM